jgi:peptidyl-prolyl cis-trans isomerase C
MKMKRLLSFALVILTAAGFLGCSREQKERKEVLARINNFELTFAEFERQLARELELDPDLRLTKEAQKTFLEELIRKELLIQEAKKRRLDRKERFIRSMERYWEATLIRDLMELKGAEIDGRTYISAEEVQDYYRAMAESEKTLPPLHVIETELIEDLKEKKKCARLEEWISDLQRKARVEVHEDVLFRD